MTLAQRMTKRMIELQRERQRGIDHALQAGSRPGFNDRGRVILVKGETMRPTAEYQHANPDIFELCIAGLKHRISAKKTAAPTWFRALSGGPVAAVEPTPFLCEFGRRKGKATRDLKYYTGGGN